MTNLNNTNDLQSQNTNLSQTLEESIISSASTEVCNRCLKIIDDYKSGTYDKPTALLELIKTIPPQQDDSNTFRTAFSAYCGMLDSFDNFRDAAGSRGIEQLPVPPCIPDNIIPWVDAPEGEPPIIFDDPEDAIPAHQVIPSAASKRPSEDESSVHPSKRKVVISELPWIHSNLPAPTILSASLQKSLSLL
jgi:hypothetical protein